jgi:hypothetical protein
VRVRFAEWCEHAYAAMDHCQGCWVFWELRPYGVQGVCFDLVISMLVVLLLVGFLVIVRWRKVADKQKDFGLEFGV